MTRAERRADPLYREAELRVRVCALQDRVAELEQKRCSLECDLTTAKYERDKALQEVERLSAIEDAADAIIFEGADVDILKRVLTP